MGRGGSAFDRERRASREEKKKDESANGARHLSVGVHTAAPVCTKHGFVASRTAGGIPKSSLMP